MGKKYHKTDAVHISYFPDASSSVCITRFNLCGKNMSISVDEFFRTPMTYIAMAENGIRILLTEGGKEICQISKDGLCEKIFDTAKESAEEMRF